MFKIKARIYLYQYNARKTPFKSGYRPLFNLDDQTKVSGKIDLIDGDFFYPGTQGEVLVTFLNHNELKISSIFSFDEGLKILGEGEILEIIESDITD
jgi:translation elongation factor EF-Tu-like GTPase